MTSVSVILAWPLLLMSLVGSLLLGWAAMLARRIETSPPPPQRAAPVTLLKPLHGPEPRLAANLASFFDATGPSVQMVCGVGRPDDPARAVAAALSLERSDDVMTIVAGVSTHGANPKIANLIGMLPAARHDILILSDSDIAVDPHYCDRIVEALDRPGVGAVTCLYRGRGDAGFWSRIGAMGLDLHFLPSVLIGLATGMARPCMGSTIALRRETLDRIGGFEAFADRLADDHAIGAAVRALGLEVAVPDMLVTHGSAEATLAELVRHEMRWNATVAGIDLAGYAGSIVLHPLPLALAGAAILGFPPIGWVSIGISLAARASMGWRLRRITGMRGASLAWIPLRDLLAFGVFVAGFFVRSVDWRGVRLATEDGRIAATEF